MRHFVLSCWQNSDRNIAWRKSTHRVPTNNGENHRPSWKRAIGFLIQSMKLWINLNLITLLFSNIVHNYFSFVLKNNLHGRLHKQRLVCSCWFICNETRNITYLLQTNQWHVLYNTFFFALSCIVVILIVVILVAFHIYLYNQPWHEQFFAVTTIAW